ncbi:MAG: TAXI family TRAP transporter solute-binding subunit [Xenococcaceae cyanobacterium MO_207.B15]|nr:TAXI family TRAP transporter solute-binding subunit [Xenococcaceae cyanobacterium MO_207.B15]
MLKKLFFLTSLCLTISSCGMRSPELTISSGSNGSGYQKISEQIIDSAKYVGNIDLQDEFQSEGSLQNLERLLNKETDFALLQLDVASKALKEGKVEAVAVLANEYIHLITREDTGIKNIIDLQQKKIAVGAAGSGIYFTSSRVFNAIHLDIVQAQLGINEGFSQLRSKEIDALVYIGPLGASEKVKQELSQDNNLKLIGIKPNIQNYLTLNFPESYQNAFIPEGSYRILPAEPTQNLSTVSTPTALVTRPDVEKNTVALLTWSIISTAREYGKFYPELTSAQSPETLLHQGLVHIHPGATHAMAYGDPRSAWLRYLRENKPLQAASIMLLSTSSIGFFIRWWTKRRSSAIMKSSRQSIAELRALVENNPQQALENVEQLRQQHRLMLVDGALSQEAYEEIEKMTSIISDRCHSWQKRQERKFALNTLKLIGDWQNDLKKDPNSALDRINQVEKELKTMLLRNEINIETYALIQQLILILTLIMCFVPKGVLVQEMTEKAQSENRSNLGKSGQKGKIRAKGKKRPQSANIPTNKLQSFDRQVKFNKDQV